MTKFAGDMDLVKLMSKYLSVYFSENDFTPKTRRNNMVFFNNIVRFIGDNGGVMVSEVDLEFVVDLKAFLSPTCKTKTHVSRHIEILKNALDYAVDQNILIKNPIKNVKTGRDKIPDIIFLTDKEIELYKSYNGLLNHVKDMFYLQILTGMSYGDLWSFSIETDSFGEWLYNRRNKTKKKYWIPMTPEIKGILTRFPKFPFVHINDYNPMIREIAKEVGITRYLKSHMGRKTFATKSYESGWSVESIADMMAIDVNILLKHYINRTRRRLENELLKRQPV